MDWRASIRKASFRGVPFGVTGAELEAGRRTVLHEFPQRDLPYAEDMGAAPSRFTLEAFVLGADYLDRRDQLEAALQKPEPGTLVHPWYGEIEVAQFAPYKVRLSAQDGGMAVFSLSFVRASEPQSPSASVNQGLRALLRAELAGELSCEAFDQVFVLAGQAEYVVSQTWGLVQDTVSTVQAVLGGDTRAIASMLGVATGWDLLGPLSVAERLWGVYQGLTAGLFSSAGGSGGYSSSGMGAAVALARVPLADFAVPDPPHAGAARKTIRQNGLALESLTRRLFVVEACRAAVSAEPPSRSAAASLKDAIVDALDSAEELEKSSALPAPSPDLAARLSNALADTRGATLAALAEAARRAPEVEIVTPRAVLPALALCHSFSGGMALEADLVARNGIVHPGFVPVMPLEALTS